MKNSNRSVRIFFGLLLSLSLLAALNVFLPQGSFLPVQDLPASRFWIALANALGILVIYGALGYAGLHLSGLLGFAGIYDPRVTNRQRFLIPALTGAGTGLFFIAADMIMSRFHELGAIPHPPFPASLVASATAGIGEEMIFRLFFISFWVWLISSVLLKNRAQNLVFWIVTVLSALAFAASHIPSVMLLFNLPDLQAIPPALMAEIILLNGVLSVFAAWFFRKWGFLAAAGVHFWTDLVWHVIYGMI